MPKKEDIDDLICQLEGLTSSRPLFYLKFCAERKYAEDVLEGNLYANTAEYFRQQELKTGERGQGDKNELTLAFQATKIQMFDNSTGELAYTMPTAALRMNIKNDEIIPLVSFVGIPLREMKFVDADETHVEFDFLFSETEFDEMKEKFGPFCVLIGARELEARIEAVCKSCGFDYIFDPVIYGPSNSLDKMKAYQVASKERFLHKDNDLAYQREYRLAVAIEIPDDHFIRIGKLKDATIIDSAALKTMRFSVEYQSHQKEDKNGTKEID